MTPKLAAESLLKTPMCPSVADFRPLAISKSVSDRPNYIKNPFSPSRLAFLIPQHARWKMAGTRACQ